MTNEKPPIPNSEQKAVEEAEQKADVIINEAAPGFGSSGSVDSVLNEATPRIDVQKIDLPVDKNQKPPAGKRRRGR